jgi:hypothetical protein
MDGAYPESILLSLDQIEERAGVKFDENVRHAIALELAEMILFAQMDSTLIDDADILLSVQDLLDNGRTAY